MAFWLEDGGVVVGEEGDDDCPSSACVLLLPLPMLSPGNIGSLDIGTTVGAITTPSSM